MSRSDVDLALAAAAAGADIVRRMYGSRLARIDKTGGDFATEADIEAERAINAVLRSERPDDVFVGEESGADGPEAADRRWLVDPLCGTLNYAAHTPLAAVNVALVHANEVSAAVSADPLADEVFWTDGLQAFVRAGGTDRPLSPSAQSRLVDLNLDPPYPNGDSFRAASLLADPRFAESFRPRVISTSLALAWVAAGRRAACVSDGWLDLSVHSAAGIALCQAAGCRVTGLLGQPVHTGVGGLVAAADEQTHALLLAMIADQFAGRATE